MPVGSICNWVSKVTNAIASALGVLSADPSSSELVELRCGECPLVELPKQRMNGSFGNGLGSKHLNRIPQLISVDVDVALRRGYVAVACKLG